MCLSIDVPISIYVYTYKYEYVYMCIMFECKCICAYVYWRKFRGYMIAISHLLTANFRFLQKYFFQLARLNNFETYSNILNIKYYSIQRKKLNIYILKFLTNFLFWQFLSQNLITVNLRNRMLLKEESDDKPPLATIR